MKNIRNMTKDEFFNLILSYRFADFIYGDVKTYHQDIIVGYDGSPEIRSAGRRVFKFVPSDANCTEFSKNGSLEINIDEQYFIKTYGKE